MTIMRSISLRLASLALSMPCAFVIACGGADTTPVEPGPAPDRHAGAHTHRRGQRTEQPMGHRVRG